MKRVLIIAGPNGVGKTALATQYLPREAEFPRFVNADLIASGLDPLRTPLTVPAGRLMLNRMTELADAGRSFALETTLSGRGLLRWLRDWRERDYRVTVFYLRLSSVELAIARVRARVEQGGHDVPEAVIRRRFVKSWKNFTNLYRPLADWWAVYDNSGGSPRLVETGSGPDSGGPPFDLVGAEVALHRAARVAERRAAEIPKRRAEAELDATLDEQVRARVVARWEQRGAPPLEPDTPGPDLLGTQGDDGVEP